MHLAVEEIVQSASLVFDYRRYFEACFPPRNGSQAHGLQGFVKWELGESFLFSFPAVRIQGTAKTRSVSSGLTKCYHSEVLLTIPYSHDIDCSLEHPVSHCHMCCEMRRDQASSRQPVCWALLATLDYLYGCCRVDFRRTLESPTSQHWLRVNGESSFKLAFPSSAVASTLQSTCRTIINHAWRSGQLSFPLDSEEDA